MSVRIAAAAIHYMPDKKFFKLGAAAESPVYRRTEMPLPKSPVNNFFAFFKSVQILQLCKFLRKFHSANSSAFIRLQKTIKTVSENSTITQNLYLHRIHQANNNRRKYRFSYTIFRL